jgi:hypothetical protein
MAHNQKSVASPKVKMDSRKFLGALNESAQARVAFFTEKVEEMGRSAGRQWRLAALRTNDLFIEDVRNQSYFLAEHSKTQGKISISNIRAIEIVEGEKAGLFEESCKRLVNAIEENDQREMATAFNRMKAQRFTGRTVPTSGIVRTRDGVVRHVNVNGKAIPEEVKNRLVSTIVESLQDKVIVENGHVEAAYFNDGARFKLPVTKWASKKLVARNMRDAAINAYYSEGFQKRITATANFIAENKIEKAVSELIPFLEEMEEFTLLNRKQSQTLVENTLAACGIFNQTLCSDTATMFYRTNMKISREKIIKEWKAIAKASEHSNLAENVIILSESKNFESAYDRFLHLVFEAISNREVAAESLATTLEVLKDKTPKIKESHELSSKLMGLIDRLKSTDFDDAAIYEAEDLIATIQEELSASESLRDFDSMPGDTGKEDAAGPGDNQGLDIDSAVSTEKGSQPIININSPLIQIGGSSGGPETDDIGDMDFEAEEPEGEDEMADDEFGDLLDDEDDLAAAPAAPAPGAPVAPPVGAPATPAAPAGAAPPRFESRNRRGNNLQESRPKPYETNRMFVNKGKEEDDLSEDEIEESSDPYSYRNRGVKPNMMMEYGAPAIKDASDLDKVVGLMQRLAVEHKLGGQALAENLDEMAKASIEAIGLRLPGSRMESAVEQAVNYFIESEAPFPGAAAPFGKGGPKKAKPKHEDEEDKDEDESDKPWEEEGVAEDQYKFPRYKKKGYGRTSITPGKKVASEGRITWLESQPDAMLGQMNGVNFIFDHGGNDSNLAPVIMSEDGNSTEIPIPARLVKSAFAAATMSEGDGRPFINWLNESIEQLRPISEDEDFSLNEAMATIRTKSDGTMEIELTGDIDVDVDDDADDMKPVDSVDVTPMTKAVNIKNDLDDEDDEDSMPNFEKGGEDDSEDEDELEDESDESEEDESDDSEDSEEEGLAEDMDMTAPVEAKYGTIAKGNKREFPKGSMPKKNSGDKLEGVGPDLKKDNGSGTNPPFARKGGSK